MLTQDYPLSLNNLLQHLVDMPLSAWLPKLCEDDDTMSKYHGLSIMSLTGSLHRVCALHRSLAQAGVHDFLDR